MSAPYICISIPALQNLHLYHLSKKKKMVQINLFDLFIDTVNIN